MGLGQAWRGFPGVCAVYVRRDKKKARSRSGKVTETTYLSIAHNVVEDSPKGKRSKPVVFANLGPEDEISSEVASSIARAFERYAAKRLAEEQAKQKGKRVAKAPAARRAAVTKVAAETRVASPAIRLLASKALGMRLLASAPWQALGIGAALRAYEAKHPRLAFPLERIVFALVLNRLVDPKSKLACNDWVRNEGYMPEATGWQVQHFYRALDILHEHWEDLEELLGTQLTAHLSEPERRMQLVDTTSLYFEAQMTDREIALLNEKWEDFEADGSLPEPWRPRPTKVNESELRMRGHNKDGHPESPQVKVALVCSPGGVVLRHRVYAGNVGDATITKDLVERLARRDDHAATVWVADAGMMGKEQMAALDAAGWDRVTAEPLRKSALGLRLFKALEGRYRRDREREHMGYKVVDVAAEEAPSGRAERWVFVRNERERERQLEAIERHLDTVSEELGRKPKGNLAHAKAVCAVASHVSYKKYLKPSDDVPGAYVLDPQAINLERRLAGVRCYRTTLVELDGTAILRAYGQLQDVEAMNKTLKHPLRLRPCYHRAERRIRAHVMLTILAANCALYLERKTGLTLEKLRALAAQVNAVHVEQGSKTYWQRSELNPDFEQALQALGVGVPAIVWPEWIEQGQKPKKSARRRS
jgi:hypothetical protein